MKSDTSCMISAENLTKRFDGRTVVDSINFTVERGEILGFLGPNAAGKTTTMKMITCYFPPTSGKVRVNGFDVTENSLEVRNSIGFLPENVPLYQDMVVSEYLEFVARAKGVAHADRRSAVFKAIERCNLDSVQGQRIATISRGYKQRVGLAQAIINNPPVLILDEPTVGLDPVQIKDIRELIKVLGKTSTVILSTHILPEVSLTCDRVLILNHGRISAEDTPDNLQGRIKNRNSVRMEVAADSELVLPVIKGLEGVSEVVALEGAHRGTSLLRVDSPQGCDVRSLLAKTVVEKGWGLLALSPDKLSLEEVFLNIVESEDVPETSAAPADKAETEAEAGTEAEEPSTSRTEE